MPQDCGIGINSYCHCSMSAFTSSERINSSSSIAVLAVRPSSWTHKPYSLTLSYDALILRPHRVLRACAAAALVAGMDNDLVMEFQECVTVRLQSAPTLSSYIDNHAIVARMSPLPVPVTSGPCSCHTGPFSQYLDVSVGHVLTTSNDILGPLSEWLTNDDIGLNFRPQPLVPYHQRYRALETFWSDFTSSLISYCADMRQTDPTEILELARATFMPSARRLLAQPSGIQDGIMLSQHESYIGTMHEHLMVTCLDKVPNAACYMCIHLAALLIHDRAHDAAFRHITDHEATLHMQWMHDIAMALDVQPTVRDRYAALYPTVKAHKCMLHDPTTQHDCSLAYRFITSACDVSSSWFGDIVATILAATKQTVDCRRDSLEAEFYSLYGFRLRHRFGISSWQSIPLSLPSHVHSRCTVITGDLKKCFENIPLTGPDGLDLACSTHIAEAFGFRPGKDLYIPIDDSLTICGKAQFAYGTPPTFGRAGRYLCFPLALATSVVVQYSQTTIIGAGQYMLLQLLGIPMGGPPCSLFCDLYLDHYEYGLICRITAACSYHLPRAKYYAALLEHYYRYCDDVFALAPRSLCECLFNPMHPRDPESLTWLYPLLDAAGNTIMSLDQDLPEPNAEGTVEDHFLCMTIALGPTVGTTREVNYRPYNKRHSFTFGYPALTMWYSYTALSIKHSSLVGMLPYAFIASSLPSHTALYLCTILDRLWANGYPKGVLLTLVDKALTEQLQWVPHRMAVSRALPEIRSLMVQYVKTLVSV